MLAHPDGYFEVETAAGVVRVPVPSYVMPDVPKRSAGYFAAPGMDLIDLFIGAEGTLGVIVEATLGIVTPAPATCLALVPFADDAHALGVVADAARAVEAHVARPGSARARRVGNRDAGPPLPRDAPRGRQRRQARHLAARRRPRSRCSSSSNCRPARRASRRTSRLRPRSNPAATPTPLGRFCRLLDEAGVLDHVEVAVPGDRARAQQFFDFREAAPEAVKHRVARARSSRSIRESRRPRPT